MGTRINMLIAVTVAVGSVSELCFAGDTSWPPSLPGAQNGTVTLKTDLFLKVPDPVAADRSKEGVAPFVMANSAPTVDLALHGNLGPDAVNRRLWSSWGDICVASDGRVYCAIGDHGNAVGGDARCFLYRWDPDRKVLEQIVDMNQVVPSAEGQPAWSKVHAKIDEGVDGKIYFCCTLNDGNRASKPEYGWTKQLPGGQLYQFDPETGKTTVYANLPPKRCTATSLLDHKHNVWWCNLEAGDGNALWGLDMQSKEPVFKSPDGTISFNRNFALAKDGSIYFNGEEGIGKYDAEDGTLKSTNLSLPETPGMRASTRQTASGDIFGTTYRTNQLFRLNPERGEAELLGPTWGTGQYTTVMVLSPDERYLYYLPGSHGAAFRYGTPVVQYDIKSGERKVLAFLAEALESKFQFVPGGTYGVKVSEDGGTLYVNFNGHAADAIRPEHMRAIGFGLTGFAAIHIPESER